MLPQPAHEYSTTPRLVRAPSRDELQSRINTARSIIGHRSGPAGMTAEDVEDMRRALEGLDA